MVRLQYERITRRISQAKLSTLTGIVKPHIKLIEQGRLVPTPDELQRIARALEVSPPSVLMTPVSIVETEQPVGQTA